MNISQPKLRSEKFDGNDDDDCDDDDDDDYDNNTETAILGTAHILREVVM